MSTEKTNTTRINVYLSFKDNCEEAMNFYKDCLGGELTLNRAEGSPMEKECGSDFKDKIMHASLEKGDLILMGSDMFWPGEVDHGNSISLSLNCETEEEIREYFAKLSAGGQIIQELRVEFWGALFGMITDKYGVKWLFNHELNQEQ
jgi:PhnB protein